ncbi:hypothetical protein, partial [Streptomyces eurythermus]
MGSLRERAVAARYFAAAHPHGDGLGGSGRRWPCSRTPRSPSCSTQGSAGAVPAASAVPSPRAGSKDFKVPSPPVLIGLRPLGEWFQGCVLVEHD